MRLFAWEIARSCQTRMTTEGLLKTGPPNSAVDIVQYPPQRPLDFFSSAWGTSASPFLYPNKIWVSAHRCLEAFSVHVSSWSCHLRTSI